MARSSFEKFVLGAKELFGERTELDRNELAMIKDKLNISIPSKIWSCKVEGTRPFKYSIQQLLSVESAPSQIIIEKPEVSKEEIPAANFSKNTNKEVIINDYSVYIPKKDPLFISYGTNAKLIDEIVNQMMFFPVYIYGVSGIGKTFQIEQACAKFKRPMFRCQINKDMCNEDLIGSYSLIDGNTVWIDGPVLRAYRSGGVLVLDEIDLNPGLMVLQVVLENKPLYVPQTGELVHPTKGFTVFATGNTKGDGGDPKYIGTSVLNDAFLERFVTITEQTIPAIKVEEKIIRNYMRIEGINLDEPIIQNYLKFIDTVRQSYMNNAIDVYLSSRRIQYILKIYKLSGNFDKSIEMALRRYSNEERDALIKAYKACCV